MQDKEYIEIQMIFQLMLHEQASSEQDAQDAIDQIYVYANILNERRNDSDHKIFLDKLKEKYLDPKVYAEQISIVKEQLL